MLLLSYAHLLPVQSFISSLYTLNLQDHESPGIRAVWDGEQSGVVQTQRQTERGEWGRGRGGGFRSAGDGRCSEDAPATSDGRGLGQIPTRGGH